MNRRAFIQSAIAGLLSPIAGKLLPAPKVERPITSYVWEFPDGTTQPPSTAVWATDELQGDVIIDLNKYMLQQFSSDTGWLS